MVGLPALPGPNDSASDSCSESSVSDDERDLFDDLLGLDSSDSEEEGVGAADITKEEVTLLILDWMNTQGD